MRFVKHANSDNAEIIVPVLRAIGFFQLTIFAIISVSLVGIEAWCQATPPPASELTRLVGTWGTEQQLGNPVRGDLVIRKIDREWIASIFGYEIVAKPQGGILVFAVPGNQGRFRARLRGRLDVIRGHWIQPSGDILSSYASPVVLHSAGDHVWRGRVEPLAARYSLYVVITQNGAGSLKASFVNPESNYPRGDFTASFEGSTVHFLSRRATVDATYDQRSDSLCIRVPGISTLLRLTRRDRGDAVGLYARVPRPVAKYTYRKPLQQSDGWRTSSLRAAHVNSSIISNLLQRILDADPLLDPLPIQSLLIARHGRLVLEEYFYGFEESRAHDMRSASKTFASVLVGIARVQGAHLNPGTPIYPLFTQYSSFANPDPRKQTITLGELMTMSAGYACDDNDDASPGNEDTMQSSNQNDWYKYTLDLPMQTSPGGKKAVYCSADLNLVGGAVAAFTKTWLPEVFEKNLARPLQFGRYYLNLMPDGQAYMGGGAYLRPRDELKIGQVFLDRGLWNGRRIVSELWVKQSIASHTTFDAEYSLGYRHEYGYGWHVNFLRVGDREYRAFSAGGNGGQFVIVVPKLDLVIGMNGGAYGEFGRWYRWEFEDVPQFILAAISPN